MNQLHYIIDGYNLIHAIPPLKKTLSHNGETARELLIHSVSQMTHRKNFRCTIVFDGVALQNTNKQSSHAPVHVLFSSPLSADAKIKHMIEHSKHRALLVIVSSDRDILTYAKTFSSQTHTSNHFANMLSEVNDSVTEKSDEPLSKSQIDEWLKIFGE